MEVIPPPPAIAPPTIRSIVVMGVNVSASFNQMGLESFGVSSLSEVYFERAEETLYIRPRQQEQQPQHRQRQRQAPIARFQPGISTVRVPNEPRCVRSLLVTDGATMDFARTFIVDSERFWGPLPENGEADLTITVSRKGKITGFVAPDWCKVKIDVTDDGSLVRARPSHIFPRLELLAGRGGELDQFRADRALSIHQCDGDGIFRNISIVLGVHPEISYGPEAARVRDLRAPYIRYVTPEGNTIEDEEQQLDERALQLARMASLADAQAINVASSDSDDDHLPPRPPPPSRGRPLLVSIDLTLDEDPPMVIRRGMMGSMFQDAVLAVARATALSAVGMSQLEDDTNEAIRRNESILNQLAERRREEREARLMRKADDGAVVKRRAEDEVAEPDTKKTKLVDCCVICRDPIKQPTIFLPCAHMAACDGCARATFVKNDAKCPICRSAISQVLPVYNATVPE